MLKYEIEKKCKLGKGEKNFNQSNSWFGSWDEDNLTKNKLKKIIKYSPCSFSFLLIRLRLNC